MGGAIFLRRTAERGEDLARLRAALRAAGLAAGLPEWSAVALATAVVEVAGAVMGPGTRCEGRLEGDRLRLAVRAPRRPGDTPDTARAWEARCPALRLFEGFSVAGGETGGWRCELRVRLDRRPEAARLRAAVDAAGAVGTVEELRRENLELAAALEAARERERELAAARRGVEVRDRAIAELHGEVERSFAEPERPPPRVLDALARLGHEFKAPADRILALCGLLLAEDAGPLTEEQRRQLGYLRASAEELEGLVVDFLELARGRSGRALPRLEAFDLGAFVEELCAVAGALPRAPGVAFAVEGVEAGTTMVSDRARLARVLRNLLSNAFKYTETGEVRLAVRVEGERVRFRVSDTGAGIPEDRREAIFESFTRLDGGAGAASGSGSGLGLAVVRQLVEVLGGTVTVRSELGRGSAFEVVVPRSLPAG